MSNLMFAKTIGCDTEKQDDPVKNGMSVTLSYTVIRDASESTKINFLTC